jgi:glycosyltransferase involved in cell wall biosynthesis
VSNSEPRISVFTPSHRPTFLNECFDSLVAQTFSDWEWVVVMNNGANWRPPVADPRVRVLQNNELKGVGAAKRYACEQARGEFLLELDHDDLLAHEALAEVVAAFDTNPSVGFVYSQCAQINEDGSRNEQRFNPAHGWEYTEVEVNGQSVLQCNSLLPYPQNVSYIWYAPNHLRAFRRTVYDAAGGYNEQLTVLDDQDIMCRLYHQAPFLLIDKCLYLQRVHAKNTQSDPTINQAIQVDTVALYDSYIEANALTWAKREGLLALDLGAAHNKHPQYLGVDQYAREGVDIVADVTKGLDLPDNSVGVIRAKDFLEHIPDKIALFNELYRVLAHGGLLLSLTPSSDGRGAFQDPTHVAYYNENSFWYFTDRNYANFVPQIQTRFQVSRLVTFFPNDWHQQHNIPYVNANLIAIKDGPRQGGVLSI